MRLTVRVIRVQQVQRGLFPPGVSRRARSSGTVGQYRPAAAQGARTKATFSPSTGLAPVGQKGTASPALPSRSYVRRRTPRRPRRSHPGDSWRFGRPGGPVSSTGHPPARMSYPKPPRQMRTAKVRMSQRLAQSTRRRRAPIMPALHGQCGRTSGRRVGGRSRQRPAGDADRRRSPIERGVFS